jgi:hypothetical protein
MEKTLKAITKRLRQLGLNINQTKTELCLFYKNDLTLVSINLDGMQIRSKKSINIVGVDFVSRLNWSEQVTSVIY